LAGFDGRSAFRTWLYRIATNVCLDAIRRRPKRVLPIDYERPSTSATDMGSEAEQFMDHWIDPYPDEELELADGYAIPEARYEQREALELAFFAALQHLPPRQRAVLILREVLAFSAAEVAEALGSTDASVNSALQRARRAVEERIPDRSQQATARSLGDEQVQGLVERFSDALQRGDTAGILAVLAEDVTFSMPPYAGWCRGREAVADSWLMPGGAPAALRYHPARANGQPAVAAYLAQPGWRPVRAARTRRPHAARRLDQRGHRLPDAGTLRIVGLPTDLPPDRQLVHHRGSAGSVASTKRTGLRSGGTGPRAWCSGSVTGWGCGRPGTAPRREPEPGLPEHSFSETV